MLLPTSYIRNHSQTRNNMKRIFLFLVPLLGMLPIASRADGAKQKIKSINITMEMPTANMSVEKGEQLVLQAAKTAYGDLFKSGVIKLSGISWEGELGSDKDGYQC